MWEITPEEINTVTIELLTILAACFVLMVILYLKKKYPKLTKEGFSEFILGVIFIISHLVFDLLDTMVIDDSIFEVSFDILDAVFAFAGLFIIGFAFYKIANYGMELWEGEK